MKPEFENISENDLRDLLDSEARRINNVNFIDADPVQFPRRFERKQDIEIAALLAATIAWGNRKMICRNADRMLAMMENRPYDFVMSEGYEDIPDCNIHRTFFAQNLRYYLRGLHYIYNEHASLEDFARHAGVARAELPAWQLVAAMNRAFAETNGGVGDSRCLPGNLATTALKRINMALRWLVRDDGIVDLGIWNVITPAQLYIPIDVHVGDVSRQLGLLTRSSNDRRSVVELTERLRRFRPEDPVLYDYALFGIGMKL